MSPQILLDKNSQHGTIGGNGDNGDSQRRGETMSVIHLKDFPDDLHRLLRIRAAEEGTSIKALMIRYCEQGLERDKKGKKKGG